MTALTPCQKCKAERDAYRERIADLERQLAEHVRGAEAYASKSVREVARWAKRSEALQVALRVAIARLNDFLLAFEGNPEPSENDTKRLVCELYGVLNGEPLLPETP